ncbi:MAG: hypothetical protein GXO65_04460 [Euryarchaeota archaeon]|nr:hypothetical protein [Euryarchaeota archaeon]
MFGQEEFREALIAYSRETSEKGNTDFTELKKKKKYFKDVKDLDGVEEQVNTFIELISEMDRDEYANRYVIQTFLLEFCRYLDKDFLFNLKDPKTFYDLKDRLKEFTGDIYESHKRFTQSIGLNSLEHLLEDYGTLLKFGKRDYEQEEDTGETSIFGRLW